MVTDGLHFTTADVIINIDDANDNAPTFNQETYSVDVVNVHEIGNGDRQVVVTLSADDPDSGKNGIVTYWISGESSVAERIERKL